MEPIHEQLFSALDGLLVGIAISRLALLRRMCESTVAVLGKLSDSHDFVSTLTHLKAYMVDGVVILCPDAAMFFANAERMLSLARNLVETNARDCHRVILSLEA